MYATFSTAELEGDLDSENVRLRVLPIAERLKITPSWTAVENMGYRPASEKVKATNLYKDNSQGFQITFRRHGGAGKRSQVAYGRGEYAAGLTGSLFLL